LKPSQLYYNYIFIFVNSLCQVKICPKLGCTVHMCFTLLFQATAAMPFLLQSETGTPAEIETCATDVEARLITEFLTELQLMSGELTMCPSISFNTDSHQFIDSRWMCDDGTTWDDATSQCAIPPVIPGLYAVVFGNIAHQCFFLNYILFSHESNTSTMTIHPRIIPIYI
jgi:hypothetical protein